MTLSIGLHKACVIGHRVAYSRSPMIHNYWLRTLGLTGSYELVDVEPQVFASFLRNLAAHGYIGGNITTPHKDAAFRLVDIRDDAAQAVGAVNTVWREAGKLAGGNTDVSGYLHNLDQAAPGWDRGGRAVVIGAGGAARAVVHGLLGRGFAVAVINRSRRRAEELASHFRGAVTIHGFAELAQLLAEARVLTNATALGARGRPPLNIDLAPLNQHSVVCDLNYVPLRPALLQQAAARGHRIADGLGMLLHQAAPAFEKWFGVRPQVSPALRALVEADISAKIA